MIGKRFNLMESHKGLYFNHFLETHFKIKDCLWDEIETIISLYFEGRVSFMRHDDNLSEVTSHGYDGVS